MLELINEAIGKSLAQVDLWLRGQFLIWGGGHVRDLGSGQYEFVDQQGTVRSTLRVRWVADGVEVLHEHS